MCSNFDSLKETDYKSQIESVSDEIITDYHKI